MAIFARVRAGTLSLAELSSSVVLEVEEEDDLLDVCLGGRRPR